MGWRPSAEAPDNDARLVKSDESVRPSRKFARYLPFWVERPFKQESGWRAGIGEVAI